MSERFCVPCDRALAPDELAHLHATRFYAPGSDAFWTQFPTGRLLKTFSLWLRHAEQTDIHWETLPFLPPDVTDHQRLVDATAALRLALGLPQVRSLLDLLDAVLARLGVPSSRSLGLGSHQRPETSNQRPPL